jgi:hypothetical protein
VTTLHETVAGSRDDGAPMRVSRTVYIPMAVTLTAACAVCIPVLAASATTAPSHAMSAGPATLPGTTFVAAPPPGAKGADDITALASEGVDRSRLVIWTAYQNGINPDGTPGTPGGPTQSTVAGYDAKTGALVKTIAVTGKVDGLTADPEIGRLIATVNEDSNSALNLISPATGAVTSYQYSPSPAVSGNGGTDSIAVRGSHIFIAASNPNDTTQPAEYEVRLDKSTHTAFLRSVFTDNSTATDAVTGKPVALGLTDPDTNGFMPEESPRFAGQLVTISQGDGQMIFAARLRSAPRLTVLNLTDNVPGNVPPIDGMAVATEERGTLYVVDNKAGTIMALDTRGWRAGTVFVGEPSDNHNPLVGTLNLFTGQITPLGNTFGSPKGLLFLPSGEE